MEDAIANDEVEPLSRQGAEEEAIGSAAGANQVVVVTGEETVAIGIEMGYPIVASAVSPT